MNDIPEEIKSDAWKLFEMAMSPDPAIAAQYAIKWITHLQIIMDIAGINEYDTELTQALNVANEAMAKYTADRNQPGHEGESLMLVSQAIGKVGKLAYDERFSTRDKNAFTGLGGKR